MKHVSVSVALVLVLGAASATSETRKPAEQEAADLIQFFRVQKDCPVVPDPPCDQDHLQNQPAAIRLVELGAPAVPLVEDAVASMEMRPRESPFVHNAWWLLHAYARLKGPSALLLLTKMAGNPNLADLGSTLEDSIALSLGLTAYVESTVDPPAILDQLERRDGLNQLIFAWENGDRDRLKEHLGPHAGAALDTLLKGQSWQDMRHELWRARTGRSVAVGYRFEVPPPWAEPKEPLELEAERKVRRESVSLADDAVIGTLFTNATGGECGTYRITFAVVDYAESDFVVYKSPFDGRPDLKVRQFVGKFEGFGPRYLVDNTDLADLLRLIGACAEK
jgi:hypothetical protein